MTHLFVINNSTKSWAFQVEELLQNLVVGKESTVLDFSACKSWRPISVNRAKEQFYIRRLPNVTWISFQKLGLINLLSIVKTITFFCKFLILRKKNLPNLSSDLAFAHDAILCRLSQTMGTRYFSPREIPLVYFFRFTREAFLGQLAYRFITEKFSQITLFNGREPLESVIVRKSIDIGIKVSLTERASSDSKYENYSISPHFQPEWWDKARRFWEESQPIDSLRRREIYQYLSLKSTGFDSFLGQKWHKFYLQQGQDFTDLQPCVVFFTTSTHEFSPIVEYECKFGFLDQFEAAKALSNVCTKLGYKLVIRRHPNSISPYDGRDREAALWDELLSPNTIVLGPKYSVNSIELAKSSHVAFVWRSSVGIETLFQGVPTYALGSARWALDESFRAWSEEKIYSVISSPVQNLNLPLEIYANYMAKGGTPLRHFKSVNRYFITSLLGDRIYMRLGDRLVIAFSNWVWNSLYRKTRRKA